MRSARVGRLAVVDAGADALRLIHAVRAYRAEHDRDLRVVVLHGAADAGNLWVREADEAVEVDGDVPAGGEPVERALRRAGVDAVWDGFGSVTARPALSEVCDRVAVPLAGAASAPGRAPPPPSDARRVAVHALVDGDGRVWVAGACEGTTPVEQARLAPDVERELAAAARRIVERSAAPGACWVAFDLAPDGRWSSAGTVPGLGAGHGVIEAATGIDLVALQLHLAAGGSLEVGAPPAPSVHAIAVDLRAVDAERHVPLTSGRVALVRLPGGPGTRFDRGAGEGDNLTPANAVIARFIAWGRDRDEAVRRLRLALTDAVVVVEGGATDRGVLLDRLRLPAADQQAAEPPHAAIALLAAAVDGYDTELAGAHASFFASARRGRPAAANEISRRVELRHRDIRYALDVSRTGPERYRVHLAGAHADVDIRRTSRYESRLTLDGEEFRVVASTDGAHHDVEVDGAAHHFVRDDGHAVRAPLPGVVVSVCVTDGDEVAAGDPVVVLESMKLETVVAASAAGRVSRVLVHANEQVPAGAVLVRLDGGGAGGASLATSRAVQLPPALAAPRATLAARCDANFLTFSNLILGYDVDPIGARAAIDDETDLCLSLGTDEDLLPREIALLTLFADLRVLFRSRHGGDEVDLAARSPQEYFFTYLRSPDADRELPDKFVSDLRTALAHYRVHSLDPGPEQQSALFRIFNSQQRVSDQVPVIAAILERWLHGTDAPRAPLSDALRACLDHLVAATVHRHPVLADLAREARFQRFDAPVLARAREVEYAAADAHLRAVLAAGDAAERAAHVAAVVDCPMPLAPVLLGRMSGATPAERAVGLDVITRRYYRMRALGDVEFVRPDPVGTEQPVVRGVYDGPDGERIHVLATTGPMDDLELLVAATASASADLPPEATVVVDLYAWTDDSLGDADALSARCRGLLDAAPFSPAVRRVVLVAGRTGARRMSSLRHHTFRRTTDGFAEDGFLRGLHPLMATRLRLSRFRNFAIEPLPAADDVYLFHARARDNPDDERLFALCEVRDLTAVRDDDGRVVALPQLERVLLDALAGLRQFQAPRPPEQRLHWNRVVLHVWPPLLLDLDEVYAVARRLAPATEGLGLEQIVVRCRRADPATGALRDRVVRLANPTGAGFVLTESDPPTEPLQPLDAYTHKVVQARRRGAPYPYELVGRVVSPRAGGRAAMLGGSFTEYDLDGGQLVPVTRSYGENTAGIVVGILRNVTARHPDGMARVALLGDPTRALGSLAEPECRRIIAALDLAEELGVPLDWFALSAGAKIAMDSGTENMDWIAAVLRRIVLFTQNGGAVNVVVTGINVGAQPYWNAEATMLMHTQGILVMTPDSAMVLTGKQALDYSGGVSADDNFGIGGYEGVMGPNGQAQYWAPDLDGAIGILLAHHEHTYVAPGERFPRRGATTDPLDRDVSSYPHRVEGSPFTTVGDIFSDLTNPDRKLAFDIRTVMAAVADQDHEPLERWPAMRDADTTVVWDAHLGGQPITLLGIESRPIPRRGPVPADGPDRWTSGTLFPLSSKKMARAVNAASGNRPVVVLANLSGFDGSPDSMRSLQLEYGAEIGRAVVNFRGPIVFCVVSRYHGGAFVVFSQALNEGLETIAVEGSRASVIGGAPAAAVVFAGEVNARAHRDIRVAELEDLASKAEGAERARVRARLADVTAAVRSEKLGEVAAEFDRVHSVDRALRMNSVRMLVPPHRLRPTLIAAVDRGMERELARAANPPSYG